MYRLPENRGPGVSDVRLSLVVSGNLRIQYFRNSAIRAFAIDQGSDVAAPRY